MTTEDYTRREFLVESKRERERAEGKEQGSERGEETMDEEEEGDVGTC